MSTALTTEVSKRLGAGEELFREGDNPQGIYRVEAGWIKLTRGSSNGREIITDLLFPGDYFDVPSVLSKRPYAVTASSLALQGSHCAFFRGQALPFSGELLQLAHQQCMHRIEWQRQMMAALATERVEVRTLLVLEMLARRVGSLKNGRWSIPMPLTRLEFAEVIGTSTETAIRALSELRRNGLISESGDCVTCSLDLLGARALAA